MNLESLFRDFNPCKFIVHCSLFTFVTLYALRLDNYIDWPYWAIFTPLWIWKCTAILGAIVGAIVWCRYPHYRLEGDAYTQFKAMLISLALHLILLMFELLACDKLTSDRHLWVLVFIPLIFGSVVSVGACVWAVNFTAKGGNMWWFGIRKSFSQFLLSAMPFLQEYGNISYHADTHSNAGQSVPLDASSSTSTAAANEQLHEFSRHDKKNKKGAKNDILKPVVPFVSIDLPD
ncbi:GL12981 [Drosophila persimilis]|uniref:GL12981 n=1 Tax=Drosophila persimilis TaxID=7234 RepID=B4GVF5_DROPE|nr:GL12981 [Drosophila persimilis]